mgnify:CR=1 FL=1
MARNLDINELNKKFTDSDMEEIIRTGHEFRKLMSYYKCAMMEIETKLNVLNEEFSLRYDRQPISSIKTRLKRPMSIQGKLKKHGYGMSVENIEKHIQDVAGVRVICSFIDDVYMLADALKSQDDITVIREKDYIESPKDNGYRSLHLIVAVPIFLQDEKRIMNVEVQIRTIAMDFWASLEHKMRYKKNISPEKLGEISAELTACAHLSASLDERMQAVRDRILEDE